MEIKLTFDPMEEDLTKMEVSVISFPNHPGLVTNKYVIDARNYEFILLSILTSVSDSLRNFLFTFDYSVETDKTIAASLSKFKQVVDNMVDTYITACKTVYPAIMDLQDARNTIAENNNKIQKLQAEIDRLTNIINANNIDSSQDESSYNEDNKVSSISQEQRVKYILELSPTQILSTNSLRFDLCSKCGKSILVSGEHSDVYECLCLECHKSIINQ